MSLPTALAGYIGLASGSPSADGQAYRLAGIMDCVLAATLFVGGIIEAVIAQTHNSVLAANAEQ